MNNASFFQRFAAWLIDWAKPTLRERAILFILYFLGSLLVGVASAVYTKSGIDVPNLLLSAGVGVFMLVSILGDFLYFGYFWSRKERFSEGEAVPTAGFANANDWDGNHEHQSS